MLILRKGHGRTALSISLAVEDGKPLPTEFRLFAGGINKTKKGDFLFDEVAAETVMRNYREHGIKRLASDFDHHTLAASRGVKAVASGYFQLELRGPELWAVDIEWTPDGKDDLENKRYAYFSPLFDFDVATSRPTDFVNFALTNTPAMHGIDALIAASTHTEDTTMDPELKKALARIDELEKELATLKPHGAALAALSGVVGLAATAAAGDVQSTVAALVTFRTKVREISGKDTDTAALGALTAFKEQATELGTLRAELEKTKSAALSAEWKNYLDGLATNGEGGKFLTPAKRDKVEKMALSLSGGAKLTQAGIDGAKEYIAEMMVEGKPEQTKSPAGTVALSTARIAVAQAFGRDVKAVAEYESKKAQGQA